MPTIPAVSATFTKHEVMPHWDLTVFDGSGTALESWTVDDSTGLPGAYEWTAMMLSSVGLYDGGIATWLPRTGGGWETKVFDRRVL
jgi:hypothetical protein